MVIPSISRRAGAVAGAAIFVFSTLLANAQTQNPPRVNWQPNVETAQRLAAQSHRLVLMHFWAPWCKPCLRLDNEVFSQPQFGPAVEANFVPVKVNADESKTIARAYGITSLPVDVIVTPTGKLVTILASPANMDKYLAQLNDTAAGYRQLNGGASAQAPPGSAAGNPAAGAAPAAQAAAGNRYADYNNRTAPGQPPAGGNNQTAQQPPANPAGSPGNPGNRPGAAAQPNLPPVQLPPGSPALGLEGYCPVTLVMQKRWVQGDKRWGAIHRNRTYLFVGPEEQQRFLANPDSFSPVISGNDPVLALDQRQTVPGTRRYGVFLGNRIYLFASEASLAQFEKNPNRYAAEVLQAMR